MLNNRLVDLGSICFICRRNNLTFYIQCGIIIGNEKMSVKKKYTYPKLFDFRIKYNAGADHSAHDSYHYYQAQNALEAVSFHKDMMRRKGYKNQTLSVEKKCPYSKRWLNQSNEVADELD